MTTTYLTIANTEIRRDTEGRYCLNDLHKAAGGLKKDQLANFTRRQETIELIQQIRSEINTSETRSEPLVTINGQQGRGGNGTYVCKELVYAYAMWISPKFHVEVIRAYDRLATDGVAVHHNAAEEFLNDPLKFMEPLMQRIAAPGVNETYI